MKEYFTSDATGKTYPADDTLRIVNISQAMWYIKCRVELYDIYPSKDFKTDKDILVFVFSRKGSKDAYDKWCKYETE